MPDREVVMGRVQVFDVNETLLDLAGLDPHFQRVFGDAGMRRVWFAQMIQSALVATVTGAYRPFGEIGLAALTMTAEQAGVELADPDRDAIAAHAWDVAGAARAGCATAFVARPGKVLDPLVEAPDVVGADLSEVADRIIAVDT
jgi:phosphoglycolate phosphatase-like HAD superfamily hydrolase